MERTYFWESPRWPQFTYDAAALAAPIAAAAGKRGELAALVRTAGVPDRELAEVSATAEEAVTTSAIEGEQVDFEAACSSVASELGLQLRGARPADRKSTGVVEMLIDATLHHALPVDRARLCHWHRGLFPGSSQPWVGRFRTLEDGPERVVTGPYGNLRVEYEAPPGDRVEAEMDAFFSWLARGGDELPAVVRAGIAHLWFVAIHPFVDGNRRTARALADLVFARAERSEHRYFSMSAQILAERADYYGALRAVETDPSLDITPWLLWFTGCYERALVRAIGSVETHLRRTLFWTHHASFAFNERQRKVLQKFLGDWRGKLTAKKWAAMTHVSIDTATRDLHALVEAGILRREGAARSTHFVRAADD